MAMFGLIVSGRLVSTSWEQAGPTNVVAEIQVGVASMQQQGFCLGIMALKIEILGLLTFGGLFFCGSVMTRTYTGCRQRQPCFYLPQWCRTLP